MGTFLSSSSKSFPKPGHCELGGGGVFSETATVRGCCVGIIGDLACSRTLKSFLNSVLFLLQSYSPTVFERYNATLQMKGKPVHLQIWDTAGKCGTFGEAGKSRKAGEPQWLLNQEASQSPENSTGSRRGTQPLTCMCPHSWPRTAS